MPKKDFKNNPALAFIGTQQAAQGGTQGTHEPHQTQEAQQGRMPSTNTLGPFPPAPKGFTGGFPATPPAPPAPKYYRLNLKLKAEHKEYLDRVSWEAHKSITQYLNDLIEADKATQDT